MSKENKGQSNWQQNGPQGQQGSLDKKSGSCECPVGGGNSQHKGGSTRDERGKYNQPSNENKNPNEGKSRKFENE
jgi:hypothetical protein